MNKNEIIGIISLKDIFEEMLKKELKDGDNHFSLNSGLQVLNPKKSCSNNYPHEIDEIWEGSFKFV